MTDQDNQPSAEPASEAPTHSTMNTAPEAPAPSPGNKDGFENGASTANRFKDRTKRNVEGELLTLTSGETVRVRRPSITNMVKQGIVPANVAGAALKFDGGKPMSDRDVQRLFELKEIVTRAAFIAPRIVDNPNYEGNEISLDDLTEDEINDVYTYVQVGLEELTRFREERQRNAAGPDSAEVPGN